MNFTIGETFSSFAQFEEKVNSYQATNFVQLWRRDCRKIAAALKKMPNRHFNPDIVYYELGYSCVNGGRSYKSNSTGIRPNTHTFRSACPFTLKLRSSEDGNSLIVKKYHNEHNHDISQALYEHLPAQRRLDQVDKDKAAEMVSVNANRKLIRQNLSACTGKKVTMRDVHNLAILNKPKASSTDVSELQEIADYLKTQPGIITHYTVDDNNTLTGIFIQDTHMQHTFSQFPELILADATHKTNELRMPFYLMTAIDGNGDTEIIAAFLLISEEEHMIRQMVNLFKNHNPKWTEIKVVLTDKDMAERTVFSEEIPNSDLQICLFHVLRTFKREITTEKMGITGGQKTTVLEIIQNLAYSRSEAEYIDHYESLKSTQLHNVLTYYDSNWHKIKKQWVEGHKHQQMSLGERTNNRIESLFQKLKSLTSSHHKPLQFLTRFISFLHMNRTERDNKVANLFYKVPCSIQKKDDTALQFQQYLTPHAFKYVEKQLELAQCITIQDEEGSFSVKSSVGEISVTATTCQCTSYTSMSLPCRHIFALRRQQMLDLFDPALVAQRWTLDYYKKGHRMFQPLSDNIQQPSVSLTPRRRNLNSDQKYKRALQLGQKLASLASECSQDYEQKLAILQSLVKVWESGKEAVVVEVILQDPPTLPYMIQDDVPEPQLDIHLVSNELIQDSPTATSLKLDNVVLPPKSKKRGRPKGSDNTVIGLPIKKKVETSKPTPFIRKSSKDRDYQILSYFVSEDDINLAMNGQHLSEVSVEQNPAAISTACLDVNVNIQKIRRYFDNDGWAAVEHVYEALKSFVKSTPVLCVLCKEDIDSLDSVVCDCCLLWVHLKCVGKKTPPKAKYWFCRDCHA